MEYYTEAIVLDKEPVGEADARIFLFTKEFGKLVARAKSIRKITSKLSAHLEPLRRIQVRLVEKRGLQIVDALASPKNIKETETLRRALAVMQLVKAASGEHHPDSALWELLSGPEIAPRAVLTNLGFSPSHARCHKCQKASPTYFHLRDHIYFCAAHVASYSKTDLYFHL